MKTTKTTTTITGTVLKAPTFASPPGGLPESLDQWVSMSSDDGGRIWFRMPKRMRPDKLEGATIAVSFNRLEPLEQTETQKHTHKGHGARILSIESVKR